MGLVDGVPHVSHAWTLGSTDTSFRVSHPCHTCVVLMSYQPFYVIIFQKLLMSPCLYPYLSPCPCFLAWTTSLSLRTEWHPLVTKPSCTMTCTLATPLNDTLAKMTLVAWWLKLMNLGVLIQMLELPSSHIIFSWHGHPFFFFLTNKFTIESAKGHGHPMLSWHHGFHPWFHVNVKS